MVWPRCEHRARLAEQVLLQGLTVLVQRVRGAVQAVQVHSFEVVVNELAQARGVLQPGVRGQLTARLGHARDDVAHCGGDLWAVQAQLAELVFKAALAHRRQRGVLHAHAARIDQLERVEIDLLVASDLAGCQGRPAWGLGSGCRRRCHWWCRRYRGRCSAQAGHWALARNELGCEALCEVLHRFGQRGIEYRVLPTHQFIDALGQRGPLRRRQIEVAAQVQQRGLLDDVAHAGTVHQAVGDVGLT
jgi:hypothetical protein